MSENVNETVANENLGTMDNMPAPQTMNYEQTLQLTDAFVNDVTTVLGELAYAETHNIIDFVHNNRNGLPVSLANQLINQLASFPRKVVKDVMHNINTNQSAYFVLNETTQEQ